MLHKVTQGSQHGTLSPSQALCWLGRSGAQTELCCCSALQLPGQPGLLRGHETSPTRRGVRETRFTT